MKNIIISGLNLTDNNRGTQALGYGSFSFLDEKIGIRDFEIIAPRVYLNPFKRSKYKDNTEEVKNNTSIYTFKTLYFQLIDIWLTVICFKLFRKIFVFSKFSRIIANNYCIAAINGGDGFSDIYNQESLDKHLLWSRFALLLNLRLIVLPQTIGPFNDSKTHTNALRILKHAYKVYVRDEKFVSVLQANDVSYDLENDLSYYMFPQKFDIEIKANSVGINISGLTYFNNFQKLKGEFTHYKSLIINIVELFQMKQMNIYLIPHSYNFNNPEKDADDLLAILDVYNNLQRKENVYPIYLDMKSPNIKYIISLMSFFIGTRMHANFAAIFTHVPVFGLSYSYKFAGSFERYNLNESYANIRNIEIEDIPKIVSIIEAKFIEGLK